MNVISISNSSDFYWKELVFVESRLGADEKTAHLKAVVTAQRLKSDDIWKAEREIGFLVEDSRAQMKTAEVRVNSHMDEVYSAASYEVKQKRKDPRYVKLIKVNLGKFKQLSFAAQKEDILRMKDVLELDLYDNSFRDAQNETLDKALVEIDRVLVMQKQVEKRQMFYRQDVEAWKNETNQVRMDVYGELILLSATPGESWARSFFPKQKRVKKLSAQELANLEEEREKKRLKKAEDALELRKAKLEEAERKSQIEKEKADAEARIKAGAKRQGGDTGQGNAANGGEKPKAESESGAPAPKEEPAQV